VFGLDPAIHVGPRDGIRMIQPLHEPQVQVAELLVADRLGPPAAIAMQQVKEDAAALLDAERLAAASTDEPSDRPHVEPPNTSATLGRSGAVSNTITHRVKGPAPPEPARGTRTHARETLIGGC